MRLLSAGLVLLAAVAVRAAEPMVIEDFEAGVSRWQRVQGPTQDPPQVSLEPTAEAKVGDGAGRLRYPVLKDAWAHIQMPIQPGEWSAVGSEAMGLWLRGDGSGQTLNVMFGNYELKPALSYRTAVKLDFTGWRQLTLPYKDFQPAGLPDNLRRMALIQFNASGTTAPIDIVLDEIVALPGPSMAKTGNGFDLDVNTAGAWDSPGPAAPIVVDPFSGVPAGAVLPKMLHGVRNHKDLHNPVAFSVDYAEDGLFAVKVGETSGYGGSRLLIDLDGQRVCEKDFPGTTETALNLYRGWYSIPVTAGRHTIKVDNDGADWITVEGYRFGSYQAVGARVRREDGAVEVRYSRPADAERFTIDARLIGRPLPAKAEAPGRFAIALPTSGFGSGIFPLVVNGLRDGQVGWHRELTVRLSEPHVSLARVAFPQGQPVALAVRYANQADVPMPGKSLTLTLGERTLPLRDNGDGLYAADLGALPASVYAGQVSVDRGAPRSVKFVVYDPAAAPRDIVTLKDGWFRDARGIHVPWGFATIGVFGPDADRIDYLSGPRQWNNAPDQVLRDWAGVLAAHGISCVRFGVNVGSGESAGDLGGHLNPKILAALRRYLDILAPLGIRAIPVLWWGHYRNFNFQGIPAYDALIHQQADWFLDPQALQLQQQYTREVVAPFKDDPRVLAWEVMNETYPAGGDTDASIRWTNAILDTIHSVDTRHLTTTSAVAVTPAQLAHWSQNTKIDFLNWHAYPTYPDYSEWRKSASNDTPREMGVYAVTIARTQPFGGRTSILGETGNDRMRELSYPEMRTLITRDVLWLAYLNGSPGGISWDAIADPREFDVLSKLAPNVTGPAAAAPYAVRVTDLEKDLPSLARYSEWSLRRGLPVDYLAAGAPLAPGQVLLPMPFTEPVAGASPRIAVTDGFQSAWRAAADGRSLLGYVRNLSGLIPQNVRTRTPRSLRIAFTRPTVGSVTIWDLDTRQPVKADVGAGTFVYDAGTTDHDFALVWKATGR